MDQDSAESQSATPGPDEWTPSRPMPVPEAVRMGIRLAEALETSHRSGTTSSPRLGPWSPPELVDGRTEGSVAADVYSLGARIWTAIAGRSPFSIPGGDDSWQAMTARILHSSAPRLDRPDVPPALDALLARCLAPRPEERPPSALAVARDLQAVEAQAGFPPTPVDLSGDPQPSGPADADPGSRARGLPPRDQPMAAVSPEGRPRVAATVWWAVGGLVLAAVAGVLVWFAASADDRAPAPSSPPTRHPDSATGAVPRPLVSAHRAGHSVAFRWRASDTPQVGDTYQWRVAGAGGSTHLTNGTTTTVEAASRVCLRVRLQRPGRPPSRWAGACA